MPSFPPMSPLSNSYYTFWAFCDLKFGKDKETMGTILYDLGLVFNFVDLATKALNNMNNSYMGFYRHLGIENNLIVLEEFFTEKTFYCTSPSNYEGKKDEIWYIRLVPNLDTVYNYSIPMTTPYVLLNSSLKDWYKFFERQGITKENYGIKNRYYNFLKTHRDLKYWHNYIMDGYSNYSPNSIFLSGIPDIEKSLPNHISNNFF